MNPISKVVLKTIRFSILFFAISVSSLLFADANANEKLIEATLEGDPDEVQKALETGTDINFAYQNESEIPKNSIRHREQILGRTAFGLVYDRLYFYGNEDRIEYQKKFRKIEQILKNAGAKITNPNELLLTASFTGNIEQTKFALENGADVDTHDFFYVTPIQRAITFQHEPIVNLLLRKDASVNLTPLQKQINSSSVKILYPPLLIASYKGNKKIVIKLIRAGANVNWIGFDGAPSALMMATRENHTQIVKILIKNGVKLKNGQELMNLIMAIARKNLELTKIFVNAGTNINAYGPHGITPFVTAVESGSIEIVDFLLKKGVDTKALAQEAIEIAQKNKDQKMLLFLKSHGIKE
ncbi:ankyrin repeat domain-containing protein [Leptospira sp. WS92.C1]